MSDTSKVVLITGASSGVGKAAALLFAERGHTVYAAARRVDSMEEELAPKGIVPVAVDVTKPDDNQRVVDRMIEAEGRIDVLINNAGFGLYGSVEDAPIDDARYQFEVNLFGLADLTQRVLPHMRGQGSGRIINTSSVAARSSRRSERGTTPRSTPSRAGRTVCASRPHRSASRSWSSSRVRSRPSSRTSSGGSSRSTTATVPTTIR